MNAFFSIQADPARDLVKIKLKGFFTPAALQAFKDERRIVHQQLRCGPNQHLSLADTREIGIQSQEMVAQFHGMLADPSYRSRKLAFVVASSLARMQLMRAIGSRTAQCFTDPVEAEEWLLAEDDQRIASVA
ncbi:MULTISPECIES: hypothetical protein [unclassified Sphingomonas]|uniref:hypothetical protein n=1 Tax=unclassified Sphingomonas TaxID=196159 RepID=UPI000BD650E1|nr:MAG: hypothetical protein B7Y98_06025 [Sphingomonas sp. 32-62-10]OYY64790.1 MAG: hypothetical protein B7Y49_08580 [Sphingomonas sp. 28-62-11]